MCGVSGEWTSRAIFGFESIECILYCTVFQRVRHRYQLCSILAFNFDAVLVSARLLRHVKAVPAAGYHRLRA